MDRQQFRGMERARVKTWKDRTEPGGGLNETAVVPLALLLLRTLRSYYDIFVPELQLEGPGRRLWSDLLRYGSEHGCLLVQ